LSNIVHSAGENELPSKERKEKKILKCCLGIKKGIVQRLVSQPKKGGRKKEKRKKILNFLFLSKGGEGGGRPGGRIIAKEGKKGGEKQKKVILRLGRREGGKEGSGLYKGKENLQGQADKRWKGRKSLKREKRSGGARLSLLPSTGKRKKKPKANYFGSGKKKAENPTI